MPSVGSETYSPGPNMRWSPGKEGADGACRCHHWPCLSRSQKPGYSVFISDEYGPYVYQFGRTSGRRLKAFTLPSKFAVSNLSPVGNTEISGNTSDRVANKGMEGLAITPDGKTLVGIMQAPL